jgi:hypothetical protein
MSGNRIAGGEKIVPTSRDFDECKGSDGSIHLEDGIDQNGWRDFAACRINETAGVSLSPADLFRGEKR